MNDQTTLQSIRTVFAHLSKSSAKQQLSSKQQMAMAAVLALVIGALLAGVPILHFLIGWVSFFTLCYAALMIFNLFVLWGASNASARASAPLLALDRASLPTYAILVPLYKETAVLPQLVKNLRALDYPQEKLDIVLLLEGDDHAMIHAAEALELQKPFRVVVVPPSQPRTKPKALNYGLRRVSSEYCVVYDAEDKPDPDQLLKAIAAFRQAPTNVMCLQAGLAYHNTQQNLLTRFFASEYSTWYRMVIPLLAKSQLLFLLGGTSNHFKTMPLRLVGGWDPYNVTEDADLGIRIVKNGYAIDALDSVTWEEANSSVIGWVKQRSRWIKGYMQTYLAHMRSPLRLLRIMGVRRFLTFQLLVGVAPYLNMVNPIFWLLTLLYLLTRAEVIELLYPTPIFYLGSIVWLMGNLVAIYLSLTGSLLHGDYGGVKLMLLMPVYWMLMSIATWRAFYQLLFMPHYWEKTQHGLAHNAAGAAKSG